MASSFKNQTLSNQIKLDKANILEDFLSKDEQIDSLLENIPGLLEKTRNNPQLREKLKDPNLLRQIFYNDTIGQQISLESLPGMKEVKIDNEDMMEQQQSNQEEL